MEKIRLINSSKETVLGEAIELAQTSAERNKGLLGRHGLESGGGLWIIPTEAVHTFWMKFAIDLVFLDRKRRVTKVVPRLKPYRLAGSWRAYSVIELPAGVAELTGTEPGDQIDKQQAAAS